MARFLLALALVGLFVVDAEAQIFRRGRGGCGSGCGSSQGCNIAPITAARPADLLQAPAAPQPAAPAAEKAAEPDVDITKGLEAIDAVAATLPRLRIESQSAIAFVTRKARDSGPMIYQSEPSYRLAKTVIGYDAEKIAQR